MSSIPILVTNVVDSAVTIVTADASNLKTILTASGNWFTIVSLQVTSDDTVARNLQFFKNIAGTDYLIGTVVIPALAGFDTTVPTQNILANDLFTVPIFDSNGNRIFHVDGATSVILKCKSLTTVTAAKTITVTSVSLKS